MSVSNSFANGIKSFHPGYFALVMATGIISTACQQLHHDLLGEVLFILNNVQYIILLLLLIARLVLFFPAFKSDLSAPAKGAGFLTFVAGSSILGNEYVQGKQMSGPGLFLYIVALIVWILLLYTFLAIVMLNKEKPSFEKAIDGSWLLLVVSTQSLAILGTALVSHLPSPSDVTMFALLSAWLVGIVLYFVFVTLIIYRLVFYHLNAAEVSPSYWVDTGAAAISALAGVTIASSIANIPSLQPFIPVIHLFSMLLWAIGTFWLPLLLVLELWRHIKAGFSYSAGNWSIVFPLGMYTVATLKLASALQLQFLASISQWFIFIALAVWLVTFLAMMKKLFNCFPREVKG